MDENKSNEYEMEEEIDIDEFGRNFREILFELQRKRILLEECRTEMNELILKQQDLERQLTNEKCKNANEEYHNIMLRNGAEAMEENRQKCSKELIKLKVQLELVTAERDSLRNQVRSQCLENNNLKRQVDDLSDKHRCHSGFQKDVTEQLSKIKVSLNQLNDLIDPTRKKQEELENISKTNNISQELLLSAKQLEKQKNDAEKKLYEMDKILIVKSAELSKLKQLLENSSTISKIFDTDTILEYWKQTCQDLESQLRNEKIATETLTNALKLSHENYRKSALENKEKIAELEEGLRNCHVQKTDTETQTETNEQTEIVDLVKSESMETE